MTGLLVLITGTGRSGTSTMSGTLHHLGLHVPGPYLGANESNPKGFFESRWSVRFHNRIAERAGIHIFDSRPQAFDRVQAVLTGRDRERLSAFLAEKAVGPGQTVVKDPRTVWLQRFWAEVAAGLELELRYVSMLRHPAEVAGSRVTYYSGQGDAETPEARRERRRQAILNVARWVNVSLLNERETRGARRAFVRYTDLLADWRPVLLGLQEDLGLRYDTDVASGAPCAVDDFIDADLRRHDASWDGLGVPADLQRVAQAVWSELQVLCDAHGTDEAASARLDVLAQEYDDLLFEASALDADQRGEIALAARTAVMEEAASGEVGGRPVDAVGGRDLLGVVARRALRRVRR